MSSHTTARTSREAGSAAVCKPPSFSATARRSLIDQLATPSSCTSTAAQSTPSNSQTSSNASDISDSSSPSSPSPDPLHDDAADSEDEVWVNNNLRGGASPQQSDETLQCPCCFALLSVQCQPHTQYEGQFRALYVVNCNTIRSKRLNIEGDTFGEQQFVPVACATCETEVGVLDSTDVYHFFNVMY